MLDIADPLDQSAIQSWQGAWTETEKTQTSTFLVFWIAAQTFQALQGTGQPGVCGEEYLLCVVVKGYLLKNYIQPYTSPQVLQWLF